MRVAPSLAKVTPGPSHEEGTALVQVVEPGKVQIASINNVKSARLTVQFIENMDIVNFSSRQNDHRGKIWFIRGVGVWSYGDCRGGV